MEVVKVMESHHSMELEEFMAGVGDQLDQTNDTLGQWFTQIQTIFYKVREDGYTFFTCSQAFLGERVWAETRTLPLFP